MINSRQLISLLLFTASLALYACAAPSNRQTGFRDDVIYLHPLCGNFPEGARPCRDVNNLSFRLYANSAIFERTAVAAQRYLEQLGDQKRETLFGPDTTVTVRPLPFTTSTTNQGPGQVVIRVAFTTYPEDMVPPMVSLIVSSEEVLANAQAVCHGEQTSDAYCLEELQAILAPFFEED